MTRHLRKVHNELHQLNVITSHSSRLTFPTARPPIVQPTSKDTSPPSLHPISLSPVNVIFDGIRYAPSNNFPLSISLASSSSGAKVQLPTLPFPFPNAVPVNAANLALNSLAV